MTDPGQTPAPVSAPVAEAPEPAKPTYTYRPPIAPQPLADIRLAPPAPPPPGRIRQSVFLVLLAIVTLAGGAGGYLVAYAPAGPGAPASAGTPAPRAWMTPAPGPSPAPTKPGDGAALHAKLIPAPASARLVSGETTDDIYDLDAFVDCCYQGDSTERWYLNARGFEFMTNRVWVTGGVTYEVQLIRFATTTGATSQQRAVVYSDTRDNEVSAHFSVPGAPGAEGFVFHYSDGSHATVMVARVGDVVVRIFANATFAPGRATASTLLRRQLANLR